MDTQIYQCQRIRKLAEQLEAVRVSPEITGQIMEGGDAILKGAKPAEQAEWLRDAMFRLNKLLDLSTRKTVREGCACCLGGKRDKLAKAIAKDNATLEERIKAANETHYVFGHNVKIAEDGRIIVSFFPEGLEEYRCPCIPQAQLKMPVTYCYCCGGHVKYHLQHALGRKLDCTTVNTVRASGGKKPCVFSFKIVD
jgi:hypothetical protein